MRLIKNDSYHMQNLNRLYRELYEYNGKLCYKFAESITAHIVFMSITDDISDDTRESLDKN